MKGLRTIATTLLLAGLAGCASWPGWQEAWADWRERLLPNLNQRVDPAIKPQLDRLYAEGAAALARNELDGTIRSWRRFVQLAPPRLPQARKLRGYVTLLDREAAKRFARQAAAGERAAPFAHADRLHVALFPLQGQGHHAAPHGKGDPHNRALLAMITVDLAKVPSLTLLERERLDALLREQQLARSGLMDPATAVAQARLLGAGTVVAGSVLNEPGPSGPGSGRYKINTAVSDVADGLVLGTQEADGRQAEFFTLQKQIVFGILQALNVKDIPPSVQQIHTRNWAAYTRFAAGLALLGEDRFDEAREAFRHALSLDPNFALAEAAFLDVPEKPATLEQIRTGLGAAR